MNKENKKIDFIQFRKNEIEYARAKVLQEQNNTKYFTEQKQLIWYKRDIFYNIFGAVVAMSLIATFLVIAYVVGRIA
ncbi:hypothetical protein JXZ92_00615 [Mycoplasma sp. CSL10137]|uniref:hypothetical protein n=1 Tax=unclassified Mycoplasma TaxID=2683645 RepID=UPI00197B10B0|nr:MULTISPECIES: hypothetical protein [unclassified Mycoplasma]MBN4083325.1 hypothetical protein [Mycoplasma sp. CSL10137]MBN4084372.1 hypothetical protein [Mycoplasma sp. CSL10166]MBU4692858.1 hypothetical protein [Mycoplasma sp. CSL7491-lung]